MAQDNDPHMMSKLKANIGAVLLKINRAYLHTVRLHGDKDVQKILSPALLQMQHRLGMGFDVLKNFLRTECESKPHLYVLETDFIAKYREFRKSCQAPGITWNRDHWSKCFQDEGIKRETGGKRNWPPSSESRCSGPFLTGVGFLSAAESTPGATEQSAQHDEPISDDEFELPPEVGS
jgi:hypothetical protein